MKTKNFLLTAILFHVSGIAYSQDMSSKIIAELQLSPGQVDQICQEKITETRGIYNRFILDTNRMTYLRKVIVQGKSNPYLDFIHILNVGPEQTNMSALDSDYKKLITEIVKEMNRLKTSNIEEDNKLYENGIKDLNATINNEERSASAQMAKEILEQL